MPNKLLQVITRRIMTTGAMELLLDWAVKQSKEVQSRFAEYYSERSFRAVDAENMEQIIKDFELNRA